MKLYFYYLENNGMRLEEREAVEKPKTYRIKNDFGDTVINKEGIGKIQGSYVKHIVLTELDFKQAKQMFHDYLSDIIQRMNENIKDYERKLIALEESEEAT